MIQFKQNYCFIILLKSNKVSYSSNILEFQGRLNYSKIQLIKQN